MSDFEGGGGNVVPETSGSEHEVDSETEKEYEFVPKVATMNFDREENFIDEEVDLFPANELPDRYYDLNSLN